MISCYYPNHASSIVSLLPEIWGKLVYLVKFKKLEHCVCQIPSPVDLRGEILIVDLDHLISSQNISRSALSWQKHCVKVCGQTLESIGQCKGYIARKTLESQFYWVWVHCITRQHDRRYCIPHWVSNRFSSPHVICYFLFLYDNVS